jgi:uncharacterized protein YqeY
MTLEVLQSAMIAAMKERNKARKDSISSLISAVKKAAIDKMCRDNIPEELVNEVILKEKKTVQEMVDTCPAERVDLLEEYKARLEVINEFAPQLISDEGELKALIESILATLGDEANNKGAVMKAVMPQLKGKVDMKVANKVLNEMLK